MNPDDIVLEVEAGIFQCDHFLQFLEGEIIVFAGKISSLE